MKKTFTYDGKVCVLEFTDKHEMSSRLEEYATMYEGPVKNRVGYNFILSSKQKLKEINTEQAVYLIAYIKGDIATKKHELQHAKYYVSVEWRNTIDKIWDSLSSVEQKKVTNFLYKLGYPSDVHRDEFGAYWSSEQNPRRFFNISVH